MENTIDKNYKTAILLATYNGELYLKEQLESLFNQTYKNWTLYIHDDGSKDNTINIIKSYQQQHKNIKLFDYPATGGAKNNFFSLLQRVDADYYFFCDQDDVWRKDKIEILLNEMIKLEHQFKKAPIAVYSDLKIVDKNLQTINKSFYAYTNIHPEFLQTFNELGAANICPGCSMLINKNAKKVVSFHAEKATMHDAWIILCIAKAKGIIRQVKLQLVYYRQHENNSLGAVNAKDLKAINKFRHLNKVIKDNLATFRMLETLNYGSFLKFIYYKYKYKRKLREIK